MDKKVKLSPETSERLSLIVESLVVTDDHVVEALDYLLRKRNDARSRIYFGWLVNRLAVAITENFSEKLGEIAPAVFATMFFYDLAPEGWDHNTPP